MDEIRNAFARQGLYRATDERVLGGVATGIGRRLGLNPWPARWLFLIVLMLIPGSQLLIYPVLWILMPEEQYVSGTARWTPGQPPQH
jgi:phage shock protein PspC (stress-responsive transcriptional regulator)